MVFSTAENPATRTAKNPRARPRIVAGRRHRADDGTWWETTGELRIIEAGEPALTHQGVAQAVRRTKHAYPVLRSIQGPPRRLVA